MMTRALVVLMLASVVAAAPATAQDARLEAARKEGTVVWYTSLALTSAEKVAKLFEAKYPGIKVEVHRTGSQRILQRVMQELRANIKNADVIRELLTKAPPDVQRVKGRYEDLWDKGSQTGWRMEFHYVMMITVGAIGLFAGLILLIIGRQVLAAFIVVPRAFHTLPMPTPIGMK